MSSKNPSSQHRGFKDHFSDRAEDYARFRPGYPPELFVWLAAVSPACRRAWDCATGSGQAAVALAEHFEAVVATDASGEHLARAAPHPRVTYRQAAAEVSGLGGGSVDLVTVAQAIHWFDLDAFYSEVRRVVVPAGLLAVWCYGTLRGGAGLDEVLAHFYERVVGSYWPPERRFIEEGYRTLPFPFEEIPAPSFQIEAQWPFERLEGYLGTWSASRRYRQEVGSDPVERIHPDLAAAWGDPERSRRLVWPLRLRLGRVEPHSIAVD